MSVGELPAPWLAEVIEFPAPRRDPDGGRAPRRGPRDGRGRRPGQDGRRWPAYVLVACGLALVPWLVVLAATLPPTASGAHWAVAWVGLDTMEAAGLVTTGVLMLRRRPLRAVSAAATAMLLAVDAWFDVATSTGSQFAVAVAMAVTAELPLAAVCTLLAVRAARAV